MADVSGTAVGVISLTIQLYDKISKLIDDYNARDEQVGILLRRLLSIRTSLRNIESAATHFEQKHPQASHEVSAQVRACQGELKELQTLVDKFIPAAGASTAKGKAKEAARKLNYSLARETIDKLNSRLVRAESALSMAMACLQLHTQSGIASQLANIKSRQDNRAQNVHEGFRSLGERMDQLQATTSVLGAVGDDVRDIRATLPAMGDEIMATMSRQVEEISRLSATIESIQAQFGHLKPETRGMAFVSKMVSKPALQRELCDQVRNVENLSRSYIQNGRTSLIRPLGTNSSGLCRCGARRRQYSRTKELGLSLSWLETVDEISHSPKCPKFQTEHHRFKGVMFTGLRRYLSMALSVGWAMNHGAGAFSMAPTLRYNCMVDSRQSPLFQLILALSQSQSQFRMSEKNALEVVNYGILVLRRMLSSKMVSVVDINVNGATALTYFGQWIGSGSPQGAMSRMIDAMMELGFSTQGVGSHYSAEPIVTGFMFLIFSQIAASATVARLVEFSQNDFLINPRGPLRTIPNPFLYHQWYRLVRNYNDISGVFGLDSPLAEALIEQDGPSLRALMPQLQVSPSMLYENGISLLHFACNWPSGLRILVESCLHVITPDLPQFAFKISLYLCGKTHTDSICSEECLCAESLRVFLDAGMYPDMALMFQQNIASARAALGILSYLRDWRDWLKGFAMSVLSDEEQQHSFIVSKSALDSQATEAIESIERQGVSVHEASGLDCEDSRLRFPDGCSIYHYIHNTEHARLAFDLGFVDIDVANNSGLTPLASYLHSHYGSISRDGTQLIQWLINHGANYSALMPYAIDPSNDERESAPAHTIAHAILKNICPGLDYYTDKLVETLCAVFIGDQCCCGCTDPMIGCTPSLVFIKRVFKYFSGYVTVVSKLLEEIDLYLGQIRSYELIRLLTFEFLGLRHTCCLHYISAPWGGWIERVQDFDELREEDSTRLEDLEALVDEFTYWFQNYPFGIAMFIRTVWADRIAEYLEDTEYTDSDSESSARGEVEYWIKKFDEIEAGHS